MSLKKQDNRSGNSWCDQQNLVEKFNSWIDQTLGTASPVFSNMPPCPFARKSLLQGKVDLVVLEHINEFESKFQQNLDKIIGEQKDVIGFAIDPTSLSAQQLDTWVESLNQQYPQILFLDDHPDHSEKVADMVLNFGECALILTQLRNKVDLARQHLLNNTDYYVNWSEEYKSDVFSR